MSTADFVVIRRRLLGWYEKYSRDLPWRRDSDPYSIWISETMLQQTQVSTTIPYYNRFMRAYPDVRALNRAPLDEVLALWSGLGYYRRAENLKRSARILVAQYRGNLPDDYANLRALPGVGEYTAGALLSMAFGKPYPAVDGNTRRVLARVFSLSDEKLIYDTARKLVPSSKPGHFNQSLMDLGRILCTPRKPHCAECPVETLCAARLNRHREQPRPAKKKPKVFFVTWPMAIVRRDGKLLIRRRQTGGMLSRLWELPGGEKQNKAQVKKFFAAQLPGLKATATHARRLGEIAHSITTRRIRAPIFLIDVASTAEVRPGGAQWRWVRPTTLNRYPTSSMTRKALDLLADNEDSHR